MGSLQFNPKTMPLRKTQSPRKGNPSSANGSATAGFCCHVRKYCILTVLAGAAMVGFMLYADQEMVRNLDEKEPPLIRKPVEYLSSLAVIAADVQVESDTDVESDNQDSSLPSSMEPKESIAENDIKALSEPEAAENIVSEGAQRNDVTHDNNTSDVDDKMSIESMEKDVVNVEQTQINQQSTTNSDAVTTVVQTENAQPESESANDANESSFKETNDANPSGETVSVETKPRLYLHVGPQKTGSSTLQSALDIISQLAYRLEDDNLTYKHITPEMGSFDCELGPWGGFINCTISETLNSLMTETGDAGQNLLLTDENLGERFVAPLRSGIDSNLWDVTVIVMYRRIHEWLVSWWNQINKTTNLDAEGKILIDENGNPYREGHKHWPSEGGVYVPEFTSWYKEYIKYWDASDLVSHHRSIEYYNLYKGSFDDVKVYNMHTDGDIVTNFFCSVLDTPNTCQKLHNKEVEFSEVNASVNLSHDILATYFYDQGLIDNSLSRQQVVAMIGDFVKDSQKDIPRKCDQSILTQIFDWLVASEKIMMSESWTASSEAELLAVFDAYVANGKICDLDRETVLQDEEWRSFFQSLGNDSDNQDAVL